MSSSAPAETPAPNRNSTLSSDLIYLVNLRGVFTVFVFLPIFPDSRIKALADLFGLFYIGMAGVVGAYMGMTAYMSAKK